MRRGTTPTLRITVGADIHSMSIHLALKCGRKLIEKRNADMEITLDETGETPKTVIECPLSQRDTLAMAEGQRCEVQIRAIEDGGAVALATTIASVAVERILQDGELDG